MIEKVKVRQKIASYESKIKYETREAEKELEKLETECSLSKQSHKLWLESKERAVLIERIETLRKAHFLLTDLRCDDLFNDY